MIIDTHVHLIGAGKANGCHISPKLRRGLVYGMLSRMLGMKSTPEDRIDEAFADKLIAWVEESELDAVGMLAFDGVYDRAGRLDRERTHFYVSNDYCLSFCQRSKKLLPIPSVNPGRRDALDELDRVVELGAVALKLLPNTQGIDLLDGAHDRFWQRMAELGIPLLTHTSFEHTLPVIDQKLGHPERLRAVLGRGVTVIAAHCAGSGVAHPIRDHFQTWRTMIGEYPNLYGDISAMASVSRFPYITRILDDDLARERIMLGSDFPIPVSPFIFASKIGMSRVVELMRITNPLQRNLEVFRALGCDDAILRRASKVLKLSGHKTYRAVDDTRFAT